MAEKTVQQVMADTIPMSAYVAFLNTFCGKMRRYWTRIENFALDRARLYMITESQNQNSDGSASSSRNDASCLPMPYLTCRISVAVRTIEKICNCV